MRAKINWLWYYYIARRTRMWPHFVARHLPKKVLYWAVVVAAVKAEPNGNPSDVTSVQMMQAIGVE